MALNFQQRRSVVTRRVVFVACLVVSLIFITIYAREGTSGPLHTIQAVFSAASTPLRVVGAAADSASHSLDTAISNAGANPQTLSELKDYNQQLISQFSTLQEYKQENEQLQALLKMKDDSHVDGVGARVVGRSAQAWDQTITLDKGSSDGVTSGLTVMSSSGVIGQVVAPVSAHTATVRLLSDPRSGAAALVQSSRAEGIVHGSIEGLLYLDDLNSDAAVKVGDVVVTSGLGGSYTKGLTIGTVVKIDAQQGDANIRAVVAPNAMASSLETVLVVSNSSGQDSSTAQSADPSTGSSSDANTAQGGGGS